ncbi:lipocalin-like domain-containing protein [Streptomyces sp. DB-54]
MYSADMVGVWTLAACYERDDEGRHLEGPLGPDPVGTLIYTADGHVSVNMMRTSGTVSTPGASDSVGYAGTWRVEGGKAVHTIHITTPLNGWAGTEQVRDITDFRPGHLRLEGSAVIEGKRRTAVLEWRRAPSAAVAPGARPRHSVRPQAA